MPHTIKDPSMWSGLGVPSVASAITGPPPWTGSLKDPDPSPKETGMKSTDTNDSSTVTGYLVASIAGATTGPPPWANPDGDQTEGQGDLGDPDRPETVGSPQKAEPPEGLIPYRGQDKEDEKSEKDDKKGRPDRPSPEPKPPRSPR